MKKSDLTVRQYEALSLICSKYHLAGTYPSLEEIKDVVDMQTDRSIRICLDALKRKGFITYSIDRNNNFKVDLINKTTTKGDEFVDKLLLTKKSTTFKNIYRKAPKRLPKDYISERLPHIQIALFGENGKSLEKLNERDAIHRWYKYLEDFPNSLIWNKIKKYRLKKGNIILDPYAGSGTTLVTSKMMGIASIGIEVNPLMCKVCNAKTEWDIDLNLLKNEMNHLLDSFNKNFPKLNDKILKSDCFSNVPRMELKQWLKPKIQNEVAFTKELIMLIKNTEMKNLLLIALCRAMFDSSNVALCPGTSFYPFRKKPSFFEAIYNKFCQIYEDLNAVTKFDSYGKVDIINDTCMEASNFISPNSIDFIITSPPYPNDLEYTRQTRLEMYLLDVVKNMDDVRAIKKKMVKGSTKLIFKEDNTAQYVEKFKSIQKVADEVDKKLRGKNWGWDYPRMIREYFGTMYISLKEFRKILKKGANCLLVVGDQTYKETIIPVGKILKEMAKDLKYSKGDIELFRVRRSTLHDIPLNEEIVILKK